MKAAVHYQYGPPEVLRIADIPKPVPSAREVLVKVHASTVNRTDSGFRSAEYVVSRFFSGLLKPKFPVLGSEFAGEIAEVGNAVSKFKVGDRVFGYDDQRFGGNAQYMLVSEDAAIDLIPEGLSFEAAAPIMEGAHYALIDIDAAKVQAGQQVMVYGATGAIGSAAVQLLKAIGAHVTAVCSTPHVALVRSLGADVVIDYLQQDYTAIQQRFDFILDAVGKSSFGRCKPLLKPQGIYISTELGKGGENIYLALITPLFKGRRLLFPIPPTNSSQYLKRLKQLVESGQFKPVIDRYYALDDIVEAHRYVQSGQKIGNVVIKIDH